MVPTRITISRKRIKTLEPEPEPEDHISKLPNSILLHILTFLPITDAIRTGLLSKRWDHLWSSIPILVFRFDKDRFHNVSEFISFVDRTLILCNSDVISRFCVAFDYSEWCEKNVHLWIRFAVNHKVEELDLLFELCGDVYNLPRFLYMNGTITKLNLRHCSFEYCVGEIYWSSLTRLSISRCYIHDSLMKKLLAGCPVLESFELVECQGFDEVDIDSLSLKELVINGYNQCEYDEDEVDIELRIYAPYLELLVITGHMSSKKCLVEDLWSLVEARLSAECEWITSYEDILGRIKHVKKLMLGDVCLQYYNDFPSSFPFCKSLILDVDLENGGLCGLRGMLQRCADLETLTIHLVPCFACSASDRRPKCDYGKYSSCIQHLKMVKIIGLTPGCNQTELVIKFLQFLLKHAKVLEKLLINTKQCSQHKCAKKDSLFAVAQTLLKIPRSSPLAEIQLC